MQTIIKKGSFDAAHRVLNERFKCFNLHGHTYLFELHFSFTETKEIGYAIDFKEIKRIGLQWIDDTLDHAAILNAHDYAVADLVVDELKTKVWFMSLNGGGEYCNPTVENIAKEVFLAMETLFAEFEGFDIEKVVIWETPSCGTECTSASIGHLERDFFNAQNLDTLVRYALGKGVVEYDDRKAAEKEIKVTLSGGSYFVFPESEVEVKGNGNVHLGKGGKVFFQTNGKSTSAQNVIIEASEVLKVEEYNG